MLYTQTSRLQKNEEPPRKKIPLFYATFHFSLYNVFIFFCPQKDEKTILKSCSKPFISQSSLAHSPQSRIDFSYHKMSRTRICFLICEYLHKDSDLKKIQKLINFVSPDYFHNNEITLLHLLSNLQRISNSSDYLLNMKIILCLKTRML